MSQPEDYLDSWCMLEETDVPEFRVKMRALCEHIEKTLATPMAERGEPDSL
jgi:hypothetical protein